MKISLLLLPFCAVSITAGYYADGNPEEDGSKLDLGVDPPAPTPASVPSKPVSTLSKWLSNFPSFDLDTILTSGPVASLIAKTGVNITEKLADAKLKAQWDDRIPLITDQNYRQLIVEEPLNLEELDQRVWFLLISVPNADPVSKFVDEKYEAAFNITQSEPDKALPHVRWGRINYLDVTEITTRWWVWKAPMLVVCRKGGQELRFYTPQQIRLVPEVLHRFLEVDGWKETPPWSGVLAPGGKAEPYMDFVAQWFAKAYLFLNNVPKWLMLAATGLLGSLLIQIMHRASPMGSTPATLASASEAVTHPGRSTTPKHARLAGDAKPNDGGPAVKHIRKDLSPVPRGRADSPTRMSARLQAKKQ